MSRTPTSARLSTSLVLGAAWPTYWPARTQAVAVVGLVDEQDAAHRPLEYFLGLGRGMADVLADQVVTGHADQLPLAQVAGFPQQLAHVHGDCGLAGARAAGEAHVQAGA